MKRLLVLGCVVVALLAPGDAKAADECRGLDVCISVPGPWVAVPASRPAEATTVWYRLSCPRNAIAAGTDAARPAGLDVTFLGALGSPIGPGVTTSREVWFVAVWAGRAPTAFRPFLGCVPTSGGGGRSTTAVTAAAPRDPFVRRVKNVQVRVGASATFGCRAGERLVGVSHALAFRVQGEPAPAWLTAVRVDVRRRAGRIVLTARRSRAVPARVRVFVQLHALCARNA